MRRSPTGSRMDRPSLTKQLLVEFLEDRTLLNSQLTPGVGLESLRVDASNYDASSILVRFQPNTVTTGDQLAPGVTVGSELSLVDGLFRVELGAGVGVEEAIDTLRSNSDVLYAQPNFRVYVSLTPDDALYSEQFALHNIGQTGGTDDSDIDAPEAWDITTGSSTVIVAVIDTGVDYTHPDLAANMWTNTGEIAGNNVDDDNNGFIDDIYGWDFANNDNDPFDDYGHGTHVAGTIGAVTDNGIGIAGIAWNVKIMAVKFLDASGGGTLDGAIQAINYASQNGASISNNSWGGGGYYAALHDAIEAAAARDHLFIAAAGNDGMDNDFSPAYPASYDLDNVISVAATDHDDQLAWFSNYGETSVDLAAPGVDILSTLPTSGPLSSPTGYGTLSGTSMATPHVSGVAALLRAYHPTWTYTQIIDQILANTDAVESLDGVVATGGRLNAYRALTGIVPPDVTGPRVTAASPSGPVQGPVSSVRISFNEAIDPTTFTRDDITGFTGPSGPLTITGLTPIGTTNRQFEITFDSQEELGDYEFTIGPDITDAVGNLMNQDRDANNGEADGDQYVARFTISEVLVYESTDIPVYIDWFWSAFSTITIDQNVTIGDLDLTLNISHPYTGDLVLYLFDPYGSYITLTIFDGYGANFTGTTFDDEASLHISSGSNPYSGSYQPWEPLGWYDGLSAQGTWTLWIDNWGFETGWLTSWSLSVTPGGGGGGGGGGDPPPPPPPPTDPPIANDDFTATDEDMPVTVSVLDNDFDPNGDPIYVSSIDWVSGGTAFVNADQTITFTPDADFNGSAAFGYTISDGQLFASANAWITVNPINDAPVASNDLFGTYRDTPLTIYEWDLTSNDVDVDFDYLSVISVENATGGTVSLEFGAIVFTPTAGYSGWAGFDYTISDGQTFATGHVDVNVRSVYYFSLTGGGTLSSSNGTQFSVTSHDIVSLTVDASGAYQYQMFFDGSDVGLTLASENVDAFTFLDDGTILVSTVGAYTVPNGSGGNITGYGEDILQFSPSSLGAATAGSWSLYFDGSDVGLSGSLENVDAIAVLPDNTLVLSLSGAYSVPGISQGGANEDLIRFTPTSLGSTTQGTWSWYFDGSDVGLGNDGEDVDAVFIQSSAAGGFPTVYLSTAGAFAVSGVSGADEDVFAFTPTRLGATTTGTFGSSLALDGSRYGLANFDLDGIWLGIAPSQYLAGPLPLGKDGSAPISGKSTDLSGWVDTATPATTTPLVRLNLDTLTPGLYDEIFPLLNRPPSKPVTSVPPSGELVKVNPQEALLEWLELELRANGKK